MSKNKSLLPLLNFSLIEAEDGETAALTKAALIFVEGKHKDSMGREHLFDPDRIQKFVQNTNKHLEMGGRLPVQMDHKKTQDFNIGDIESALYTKVITAADLPNKKFEHLIGKIGVFADKVVIKSKKAIADVKAKIINTLSPGLDPLTESFIEVSATPTPAIIGPALFSKSGTELDNIISFEMMMPETNGSSNSNKAFSFEQLKATKESLEKREEEYEELTEDLFEILSSIYEATEEELAAQQINPIEASYEAIEYFLSKVEEMFALVESSDEEDPKDKYLNNKEKTANTVAGSNSNSPYPTGKRESDFSKFGSKKKTIGFVL